MENKRLTYTILGRNIGTATGWDELDLDVMVLYEFEPAEGINLPKGDLYVNYIKGIFQNAEDDNSVAFDMIDVLKNVERVETLDESAL